MTLDELAGLAEKATPGPYLHDRECSPGQIRSTHIPDGKSACITPLVAETSPWGVRIRQQGLANADFIAACDPATILKLLAVVKAAKAMVARVDQPQWFDLRDAINALEAM